VVRLIATGAPKSGTTALTILIETGFGIPRSRGALGQRAGVGDVWITFDEDVYAWDARADTLDSRCMFRHGRLCARKLVQPLARGLAQITAGEMMHAHIAPRPEI